MYRSSRSRSVATLIAASLFLTAEATRADVFNQSQAGVVAGHAVMLDLRMPLGATRASAAEPKLTLAYGPSWRAAPGPAQGGGQFTPRLEASLAIRDRPIVQFHSWGLMKRVARRMNAEGEPDSGNGGRARYVLGGLLIVGAVVAVAVNRTVDTYEFFDEHIDDPQGP